MTVLGRLLEFKWRSIPLPIVTMSVMLRHDKAEHKVWKRQGANIENTGRQSLAFSVTIPFNNVIAPGEQETWQRGSLYPNVYRDFLDAMAYPATGDLQHPELGIIKCKPVSCDTKYEGAAQGGCTVTAEWIETIDLNEADSLIGASNRNDLETVSQELDSIVDAPLILQEAAALSSISGTADLPVLPNRAATIFDLVNQIGAIGDQARLFSMRAAGIVDKVDYTANALVDSFSKIDDPLNAKAKALAIRMRLACHDLKKNLAQIQGSYVIYRVPENMTFAMLVRKIGVSVDDILPLNPTLCAKPIIKEGTTVRYIRA